MRRWPASPYAGVVLLMCVVAVSMVALAGWRISVGRQAHLAQTRALATDLASSLAKETEATIQIADAVLIGWREQLQNAPHAPLPIITPAGQMASTDLIAGLAVFDDTGQRVDGWGLELPFDGLLPGQLAFHRDGSAMQSFVGAAPVGHGDPRWTLFVSRRLEHGRDRFAGVAVVMLKPARVARMLEAIAVGPKDSAAMATVDGTLIVRQPLTPGLVGVNFGTMPVFHDLLPTSPVGLFEQASAADGELRIFAYHRVGATSLAVIVGLSKAAALEYLQGEALLALVVLLGLLVLITLLSVRLIVQIRARMASLGRLQVAEEQLRTTTVKLRESNRLLLMSEDMAHVGHWRLDLLTGAIHWSEEVFRIYGLPRSTPITRDLAIGAYHPEDRGRVTTLVSEAIERGAPFNFELRIVRPDGEVRDVSSAGRAEHDEYGTIVALFGIFADITDRRSAERDRARLHERAAIANRASRIGVWEWIIPTSQVMWDDAQTQLYGLPEGTSPSFEVFNNALHPDDRERTMAAVNAALNHGPPYDTQFRVVWPSGEVRHLRAMAEVVWDASGEPLRMIGSNWDVTKIEMLTRELQEEQARLLETVDKWTLAKEAAEEANRAKSDFLTAMSHELRTPMNGVLGFAQLLRRESFGNLGARQAECVAAILSSGNHLLKLIDDVLDLSQVESGKLSISPEEVDLRPLMLSVTATLSQFAARHDIMVEAGDHALGLPPVLADRTRLSQALINLGSNAIKYNRPGGLVTFAYTIPEPGWVRISVTDNGLGIPEGRQAELFQPFNRLGAEKGGIEGTGIGLSLTRRIVDLMGGRIGFRSTEGLGSSFWIDMAEHLPAPADRRPGPAGQDSDPGMRADRRSRYSILYVEDNPLNRKLIRDALSTLDDVALFEASDGAKGLAMAQEFHPDIILLDINLPDINGFALLQQLRRKPDFAATPILGLSANAMPRDVRRGMEAGFYRYLTKPVDVDELLDVLDEALGEVQAASKGLPLSRDLLEASPVQRPAPAAPVAASVVADALAPSAQD